MISLLVSCFRSPHSLLSLMAQSSAQKSFLLFAFSIMLLTPLSHLRAVEHNWEFHGYTRMGLAVSDETGNGVQYKAPGAWAKYRLGNESDSLIRLRLNYSNKSQFQSDSAPYIKAVFATQGYQSAGSTEGLALNKIPKAYMEFVNYLGDGLTIWAGRRWYERKGVHIANYFWLNSGQWAQAGMGVEGFTLGDSDVKLAVFKHEDNYVQQLVSGALATTGNLDSTTFDARILNLDVSRSSRLNFWFLYALRHENVELGFEQRDGYGIGSWLDTENLFGGKNTLALTYRKGAAMHQSTTKSKPINEHMGFDLEHASVFEINNTFMWDDNQNFAIQWLSIIRSQRTGVNGVKGDKIDWFSTGARPIFYISQTFNVATEFGFDYVKDETLDTDGTLSKVTLAIQYTPEKAFMSRPAFRFYTTYAAWSDDFKGKVGYTNNDAIEGPQNDGWTLGTQIEHIW